MSEPSPQTPTRGVRVWPGIVILVLQWLAIFGPGWVDPGSPLQFFGMMGGGLGGTLLLLLWWLLASRTSWRERLVMLAITLGAWVVTSLLLHPTAKITFVVVGIPLFWLAFVATAALARHWPWAARRRLMTVSVLLVCVGWLFVRTEGVDGDMSANYAFRWSATAEQRLLETVEQTGPGPAVVQPPPSVMEQIPEWPGFRGAHRDGVMRAVRIATDWDVSPPQELWRRAIGPGWSSFAVVGDRLYTQEQRGEEEMVSCYSASTGERLWVHSDTARFWEAMAGAGPRGTPTYRDGRIYSFGATGILNCLNAHTGELLWSRDSAADTGAPIPDWGFAASPLIIELDTIGVPRDNPLTNLLVIVHTGAPDGKGVVAYDAGTGEPRWYAPAGPLSYSSLQEATIDGVRQLLILTGDGAASFDPRNGDLLWEHEWLMAGGARIVQPAVLDDGSVLIGTGFGMGVRRVSVSRAADAWTTEERWTTTGLKPYFNDFVVHEGHLYGFDGRILACLDQSSGERVWKGGRYGNGQLLLLADQDLLVVLSDRGDVALVAAEPSGFSELARFSAIEGKTWNHPVVANGTLFVRNGEEMAAFRLAGYAREE